MENILAIAFTFFAEMFISYFFFSQIGDKKFKSIFCLLIGTAIFESGALVDVLFSKYFVWLNTFYFIIINVLFGICCFKVKFSKVIFYSLLLDVFSTALEVVSIFIISTVTNTRVDEYLNNVAFFIIDVAVSKTLYFLTCLILARLIKENKRNIKFPVWLYFYPIVIVCALLVFWSICVKADISSKQQIALSLVSAALFISTVILFILYQNSLEHENKIFVLQNELDKAGIEKAYYDILEKQNKELMIYAHDTKKHLNAIRDLNNDKVINEYIDKMTSQLKIYSDLSHSGNHMLDVIINRYVTECKIKEVSFSFDVRLANFKYIDNYDLVTIFGNILDNALEAAMKSDKKKICLLTEHRNTYDVVILSNSCDDFPFKDSGILETTKGNKKTHGVGLKSVTKALKKYNGDLEWDYNDKVFTITLAFLED